MKYEIKKVKDGVIIWADDDEKKTRIGFSFEEKGVKISFQGGSLFFYNQEELDSFKAIMKNAMDSMLREWT